ncbi:MAG TPA: hypothetical protein VN963_06220, partial [bacterium]|nr:hypothetical protein [bacterium]
MHHGRSWMKSAFAKYSLMICLCCAARHAHALSWPQQAGGYTRDSFQTANNFQVVTGLASAYLSLSSTGAASSNTLVVDEHNAYWATGSGSLMAVQLSTTAMAWP